MELRTFAANFDVCSLWKHRVQMRCNCDQWAIADTFANTDDVSFRIDIHVGQSALAQQFSKCPGAFFFFKRRRLDLRNLNRLPHKAVVVLCYKILCRLKRRIRKKPARNWSLRVSSDAAEDY